MRYVGDIIKKNIEEAASDHEGSDLDGRLDTVEADLTTAQGDITTAEADIVVLQATPVQILAAAPTLTEGNAQLWIKSGDLSLNISQWVTGEVGQTDSVITVT